MSVVGRSSRTGTEVSAEAGPDVVTGFGQSLLRLDAVDEGGTATTEIVVVTPRVEKLAEGCMLRAVHDDSKVVRSCVGPTVVAVVWYNPYVTSMSQNMP